MDRIDLKANALKIVQSCAQAHPHVQSTFYVLLDQLGLDPAQYDLVVDSAHLQEKSIGAPPAPTPAPEQIAVADTPEPATTDEIRADPPLDTPPF